MTKIFGDGKAIIDKWDAILSDLTITIGDRKHLITRDLSGLDELQLVKAELERIEAHLQSMTDEEMIAR